MYAYTRDQSGDGRAPEHDDIVELHRVSWRDYERLLAMRGESSAPRITYLEGRVEIMSPSRSHEGITSAIAFLVAAWCFERGIRFGTYRAWTLKSKALERGAEADECFIFGDQDVDRPHLAIEVVWTPRRIDKLEVYRLLGVREVWIWRKGRLQAHALRGDRYVPVVASEVLPGIDLEQLVSFVDRPSVYDAVAEYRAALKG